MAHQLSRRDIEEVKSSLDRAIYRTIGKSDSSLLSTVSLCLTKGYDRRKMIDKISSHVESKKASRLAEKVIKIAEDQVQASRNSKKRSHDVDVKEKNVKKQKTEEKSDKTESNGTTNDKVNSKPEDTGVDIPAALSGDQSIGSKITGLSADKIKLMMANAQREIEERKRALVAIKDTKVSRAEPTLTAAMAAAKHIQAQLATMPDSDTPEEKPAPLSIMKKPANRPPAMSSADLEKQRKIAELQARIQAKLAGVTGQPRPAPLILDSEGRTIDTTGKQVELTRVTPTLKANIRAKQREEFRAQMTGAMTSVKTEMTALDSKFVDPRVQAKAPIRLKRSLKFHEPGKFQQMAERLRMKAQLEKLQNEISQIARKTGISSATKLALLAPDGDNEDNVPDIEWWDSVILMTAEERDSLSGLPCDAETLQKAADRVAACNMGTSDIVDNIQMDSITNLVEHPQRPPVENQKTVCMPVFLTKKEQKKLRRQNRREAWKEEQEKVRLGLEAPAEPKLRISNLMRALGTEAVQDPTAIEARVRDQMAARQKTHLEANESRKLSKDQRKEKIDRKLREDTTDGVHVAVYRVKDLFESASNKFKVERNAAQLHMTGIVVLHRGCCVVVVEGGPGQHAKYKRLMLHRIKWSEDIVKTDGKEGPNTCDLVWEGLVKQRAFGEMKFKAAPTEKMAREVFEKFNVAHYWDTAYSGAVLANTDD